MNRSVATIPESVIKGIVSEIAMGNTCYMDRYTAKVTTIDNSIEDVELKEAHKIEGSPTYYLNEGRQKLYGNVGYRILEANVLELMQNETSELASWC